MSEKIVCRLRLTVTGTRVDGKLCWSEEIWVDGIRRHMSPGTDVRDYEPAMCRVGADALERYEESCQAEWRERHGIPKAERGR